jgi:K+-sensing histidine kinase KdpD
LNAEETTTVGGEGGGVGEIRSNINAKRNSLKAVIRNAKRLEQLSQLILDVTKIENKSLNLRKELLNLNDVILTAYIWGFPPVTMERQFNFVTNPNVSPLCLLVL